MLGNTTKITRRDGEDFDVYIDDDGNVDYRVLRFDKTDAFGCLYFVVAVTPVGYRLIEYCHGADDAFILIDAFNSDDFSGCIGSKDDHTLQFIETYFNLNDLAEVDREDVFDAE